MFRYQFCPLLRETLTTPLLFPLFQQPMCPLKAADRKDGLNVDLIWSLDAATQLATTKRLHVAEAAENANGS